MAEYVLKETGVSIDEILARAKEGGRIDADIAALKTKLETEYLPLKGGTMTGTLNTGTYGITSEKVPAEDKDVANKQYVDAQIQNSNTENQEYVDKQIQTYDTANKQHIDEQIQSNNQEYVDVQMSGVSEKIDEHIEKDVNTEDGVHGLRISNETVQYKDGEGTWKDANAGSGGGGENLISTYENTTVTATAGVSDDTYEDYPIRYDIEIEGLTVDYSADVRFAPTDTISGNFAPFCETADGILKIWAKEKPAEDFTIPIIICTKVVK